MDNKKKYILLVVVMMLVIILVGTYAWLTYRTNDTAMVLTIGDIQSVQVTLSPYQIKGTLNEVTTYTSGKMTEVEAINSSSESKKFKLYYQINSIDSSLATSSLKYTITRSTNGTSYSSYKTGNFAGTHAGSNLVIMEETLPAGPNLTYKYKVYLWLNSGSTGASGSFDGELRAEIVSLPSQYQRVEYIQSSGTQYIDTGYYWQHENIEIYFDGKVVTNSAAQSLFGNEEYTTSSGNTRNFAGIPYGTNGTYAIYLGSGSQGNVTTTVGTRFTMDIKTTSDKNLKVYKDSTQVLNKTYSGTVMSKSTAYLSSSASTNVGHMFIFSNHNSNRGSSNAGTQMVGAMQLYAFKMYDNDVLVRNFVPCYDKEQIVSGTTHKAGLCDLVTNQFYENKGTGYFTYGSVV